MTEETHEEGSSRASRAAQGTSSLAAPEAQPPGAVRLTVDEHPSLGLQISIENDLHGFRIKGPKYAGTSRRLMTAELDDRARREIAAYIGCGDLIDALQRLVSPAPGVKALPPWAVGIARSALAKATSTPA